MTTDILEHYGVKGMKWGKSKASSGRTSFTKAPRKLSDAELNRRIKRLETEKKLQDLNKSDVSKGRQMVTEIMKTSGTRVAKNVATAAGTVAVAQVLSRYGSTFGGQVAKRL